MRPARGRFPESRAGGATARPTARNRHDFGADRGHQVAHVLAFCLFQQCRKGLLQRQARFQQAGKLARLRVEKGDALFVSEAANGGYTLSPYDPALEEQLKLGREFMREYRDTFHQLAK